MPEATQSSTKTNNQPAGTNGTAVVAFVLSLIGFGVVSIILGIVALNQIKKGNQKGKGFAIAGIAIGALTTLIVLINIASSGSTAQPSTPPTANSTVSAPAPETPAKPVEEKPVVVEVPTVAAVKLVADYDANQLNADKKYKDKVYKITGTIDDFGSELLGNPYVSLVGDGYFNTVRCGFGDDQADAISKLSKGQQVTFQGTIYGDLIGSVSVNDCSIVK